VAPALPAAMKATAARMDLSFMKVSEKNRYRRRRVGAGVAVVSS
jgi:hypothetical protein